MTEEEKEREYDKVMSETIQKNSWHELSRPPDKKSKRRLTLINKFKTSIEMGITSIYERYKNPEPHPTRGIPEGVMWQQSWDYDSDTAREEDRQVAMYMAEPRRKKQTRSVRKREHMFGEEGIAARTWTLWQNAAQSEYANSLKYGTSREAHAQREGPYIKVGPKSGNPEIPPPTPPCCFLTHLDQSVPCSDYNTIQIVYANFF